MGRTRHHKHAPDQYAKLEPRVFHISQAAIRKNWKRLPATNHSTIREMILSVKDQSRVRRGKAGVDLATEESVQALVNNLTDRLTRIPYPPATDEHHFDHEANIHRINRIEEQLNANMHSTQLLSAQLAKEEQLLRQDKAEVEYLEQSLHSNEVFRRQQSKTLHPVARKMQTQHHDVDLHLLHSLEPKYSEPSLSSLFRDEGMVPILEQLQNHLGSMYSNLSGIQEVKVAVQNARRDLLESQYSLLQHEPDKAGDGGTLLDGT